MLNWTVKGRQQIIYKSSPNYRLVTLVSSESGTTEQLGRRESIKLTIRCNTVIVLESKALISRQNQQTWRQTDHHHNPRPDEGHVGLSQDFIPLMKATGLHAGEIDCIFKTLKTVKDSNSFHPSMKRSQSFQRWHCAIVISLHVCPVCDTCEGPPAAVLCQTRIGSKC